MRKSTLYLAGAALIFVLLILAWLPSLEQPALALPPRPEPTPTTPPFPPTEPPSAGGFIELQAKFGETWSVADLEWQALWTVVQWQDGLAKWHDVEGWQGNLDQVRGETGYRKWWVAPEDFGKGPFRWVVYSDQGEGLLAASDSFNLPTTPGETVPVEVTLKP